MIESPLLSLFFLFGASLLSGIESAIQRLGRTQIENLAAKQKGLARHLFKKSRRKTLSYALNFTKIFLLLAYSLLAFFYSLQEWTDPSTIKQLLVTGLVILLIAIACDTIVKALCLLHPRLFVRAFLQIASLYLLPFYPLCLLLYRLLKLALPSKAIASPFRLKDQISEILHDSEFAPYLDQNDQKLIMSVVSFKERIAREVMVPRINMFTLPAETTVSAAAQSFLSEEYSRIPIWKENVDNVIGTLYYKDLLATYFHRPLELDQSIEKLIKPIVYTPETKKISELLQEFRNKQNHMAIVVDEYGGTEGIVTIEDILEELVGEIADETDTDEELLYTPLPSGGWIIDAKMTIIDIEEELGIMIPQSPEYDTLGGYIFHKAGTIPTKGWRIHQNLFDLEVLSSSERNIEKIRIIPH